MSYYYECDACGHQHGLSPEDIGRAAIHRNCDDCGQDGCDYCMPHGVCDNCVVADDDTSEDDYDDDRNCRMVGCIACLNDWSHG